MRDDFSAKIKDTLAKRVAFTCSNPSCNMLTIGPSSLPDKTINVGVAAHITAASEGGPRFNPSLTNEERSDIDNGIWLCQSCSKLIDSDVIKYSEEILKSWKNQADANASIRLNKQLEKGAIFAGKEDIESIKPNGFYEKSFGNNQKVRYFLDGKMLHVEHEPAPGIVAYYILAEDGSVTDLKFPFPLSEYTVEIEPNLVLRKEEQVLASGMLKEVYFLKWNNYAEFIWDINRKLESFHISKQGTIDHLLKKITIAPPNFKS
jgi:hypothetical protein